MRKNFLVGFFVLAAILRAGVTPAAEPSLVITLRKDAFVVGEPIRLGVEFRLGHGCWTLDPNVTTLTFKLSVLDERGREVPDGSRTVMYDLPGCNLAVFCDVVQLSTSVFLDDGGPDMYAPYYELPPGHYQVQAAYDSADIVIALQEDEDHYCWDKIFRKDLIKHLESNVVEFEVLPTESGHEASASEKALGRGTCGAQKMNPGGSQGSTKLEDGDSGGAGE